MGSVTELSELVPSLPFQEAGKVLNQTQSIVNAIIKVDGAQVVMGGAKGLIKDNAIETGDHLLYDTNKGANVQIDDRDVLVNGRSVIGEQDHPFVLIRVELHAKPGNLRAPDTETEGNSLEKGINAIIDTMLEDIRRYRKNEYGSKIVRALHEPFLALADAYQNTAYLLPTDAASAFQQVKDGLFRGLLVSVNPTDRQYLQDFFDLSQLTQPAATPTTGAPANAARAGANALRGGETTYPGSLETPVALLRAELPTTFDWNIKGQPINPEAIRQRFQELELQASRKKIPAKRASMSS